MKQLENIAEAIMANQGRPKIQSALLELYMATRSYLSNSQQENRNLKTSFYPPVDTYDLECDICP